MKKREKTLLIITISTAFLALLYIKGMEPLMNNLFMAGSKRVHNQKYIDIWNRKENIVKHYNNIFKTDYWKNTPQEQLIAFQIYLEKTARQSGISQLTRILPITSEQPASGNIELAIKLDINCTISVLTGFLYKITNSAVPVKLKNIKIYSESETPGILKAELEISTIWAKP